MKLDQPGFESRVDSGSRFENGQRLFSGFHLTLPSINGFHSWEQIDASRQLSFH